MHLAEAGYSRMDLLQKQDHHHACLNLSHSSKIHSLPDTVNQPFLVQLHLSDWPSLQTVLRQLKPADHTKVKRDSTFETDPKELRRVNTISALLL